MWQPAHDRQLVVRGERTAGTAHLLRRHGIVCRTVPKHFESTGHGERNTVELIEAGEIDLVINTPHGSTGPRVDGYEIRQGRTQATAAVDEVLESGLLTGDNDMLRFSHELIRPVAEASMPRAVVAALRAERAGGSRGGGARGPADARDAVGAP